MASAFTHAFVGAAVATLAPRPFRGVGLGVVLAAVAAAPDLDVVGFRFGVAYADPLGHRGLTHSLPFALIVGLALAWPLARWRGVPLASRAGVGLIAVIALACASHGVLDAFTDGGLGVGFLIPFDARRFFAPWRPLLTSPLRAADFFDGVGLEILRNEMTWVWLPVGLCTAALFARRRRTEVNDG